MTWLSAVLVAMAVLVVVPPPVRQPRPTAPERSRRGAVSMRPLVATGAGLAGWGFVGGSLGWATGVVCALAAWFAQRRLIAHVSLSDESDYAAAFVVVETMETPQ